MFVNLIIATALAAAVGVAAFAAGYVTAARDCRRIIREAIANIKRIA